MKKPKVGFVGMGIMGQPMALNILKAGYKLMVYNRSVEKIAVIKLVLESPAGSKKC